MSNPSLADYLPHALVNGPFEKSTLRDGFLLCNNGNVIFHWADFYETCEFVKNALQSTPELREDFLKKEKVLNRLKLIPVWMRTQKKVLQTTMFELYEHAVQNRFYSQLESSPGQPTEISLISSTGPFRLMTVAECFNPDTYRDFVMVYLIKDQLPRRDYRVRLKSKVLAQYGSGFSQSSLLGLEQLTLNGILFSVDAGEYLKHISKEQDIKFLIDATTLTSSVGKNLVELREYLSQFAFNLFYSSRNEDSICCKINDFAVQAGFDYHQNNKVYLFIAYDKLSSPSDFKINYLKDFVLHTKLLIQQNYLDDRTFKLA